jgi:hypothetical protein
MNCDLQIPSLPREFKGIIEGCLQKDRRQRWTAQQVLNALQPQATGKMPVSQIPLKTAKADFTQLERYLAQGEWREASNETGDVMCQIMGKEEDSLDSDDCQNFPREELKIIDQLWIKYSNGKFGFSVQKKIWLECGGKVGVYDEDIYDDKFGKKIGWFFRPYMGFEPQFDNIDAPQGHLPWILLDVGNEEAFHVFLFSRL